jgi:phage/plasmid-like protein (TIGR03299 family)
MAHELEILENGDASMFIVERHPVWHGLGERVSECLTARAAIKKAKLDWSVFKEPVGVFRTIDGVGQWVPQDDQFAVTRDRDQKILGYVGKDYVPFVNSEAFDFFDHLVDSEEAKYESAGALYGGKRIWLAAKVNESLLVAGQEVLDMYLYLETSHDGSRATTVGISPVLPLCANTLNMAMSRAKQTFSIRHTESANGKIQEARETLQLTFKFGEEFKRETEILMATDVTDQIFEEILKAHMVPQPKATPRNISTIITMRHESPRMRDETRTTAWGSVQALTEWSQHAREYRTAESRMKANMGGWAQGLATKVTKDLLALGGAK